MSSSKGFSADKVLHISNLKLHFSIISTICIYYRLEVHRPELIN